MKNKVDNFFSKKINILIITVIFIVVLCIIFFIVFKPKNNKSRIDNNTLQDKLEKIGSDFYENYYYSNVPDEEKTKLSNYRDNGIRINLTNLSVIISMDDNIQNQLKKDQCDFDQTKIVIYPKEPYGKQNYSIELELSCKK